MEGFVEFVNTLLDEDRAHLPFEFCEFHQDGSKFCFGDACGDELEIFTPDELLQAVKVLLEMRLPFKVCFSDSGVPYN